MIRTLTLAALALVLPLSSTAQDNGVSESGDTRSRAAAIALRENIRNDALAPTVAPRGYDVTVVVFSDYQCGYCRRFSPTLDALMAEDRKVRVVYRDWPILGGGSGPAARAAIAASFQKKHLPFHRALIAQSGRIDTAKLRAAADASGVDWTRLERDQVNRRAEIDALLARTNNYARMIGLTGTPGMLVGQHVVPGMIDLASLKRAVAQARSQRAR